MNPSDLMLITGRYGHRPSLLAPLGAGGVGRIVAVGGGVDPARIGERVVMVPTLEHGTWQDQTVVNAGGAIRVDPAADALQLSMLGINPFTADLLLRHFTTLPPRGRGSGRPAPARPWAATSSPSPARPASAASTSCAGPRWRRGCSSWAPAPSSSAGPTSASNWRRCSGTSRSRCCSTRRRDLVTELASRVTFGGTAACYGAMSGAPTAVSPADLIFRDVSVRGFWVKHWLEATAPAEIAETYGRLAALVADGTLRAPVAAPTRWSSTGRPWHMPPGPAATGRSSSPGGHGAPGRGRHRGS